MVISAESHMDSINNDLKDISNEKMENLTVKVRSGSSLVNVKPIFSYDSKCLIVASGPNIKIFNVQSCECLHTLRHHKTNVISLQENKNNCLQFYSCSEDGIVVRWETIEGTRLRVYDLRPPAPITSFYAPTSNLTWFVTRKLKDKDTYKLVFYEPIKGKSWFRNDDLLRPVLPSQNAVAFGHQGSFVASVHENVLELIKTDTKQFVRHFAGAVELRCVTCHPTDFCVATGDSLGKILVWSNIFEPRRLIRSIYHWHTLPVADLAFSTEGYYLYSGGGEACLVKWNLFQEEKWVLPRMGAPIIWIKDSPDSGRVVVSLAENSLHFIDPQRNVVGVIQGLTRGHFRIDPRPSLLSTGLLYDPQSKSIVLNGRVGHLQFYNVFEDKHLFELDISGRNYVTDERDRLSCNIDVSKAAIDEKGQWLATVEYWSNDEVSPMIDLKFWEFNLTKQVFVMNTRVELPHSKAINCVAFRPYDSSDTTPVVVTTSEDCYFKIWTLIDDASFEGRQSWSCTYKNHYRDHLPTGDASFSEDGSVLAIAVKNIATLWTDNGMQLEAALFQESNERPIKQLRFGRFSCKHLLVCHDGSTLCVWNVLSLSLVFTIHVAAQTIAVDITSDRMAVFAKDDSENYQNLYLFKPDSPHPLFVLKNVSEKTIMSSIFVPKKGITEQNHLQNSQLYFYNEDQCLLTLTDDHDDQFDNNLEKVKMNKNLPLTPFGFLQAQQKASDVKEIEQQPLVIQNKDSAKDSMYYPNPTYMDHFAICSKVLRSFLKPKIPEKLDSNFSPENEGKNKNFHTDDENLRNGEKLIKLDDVMEIDKMQNTENISLRVTDFSFLRNNVNFKVS